MLGGRDACVKPATGTCRTCSFQSLRPLGQQSVDRRILGYLFHNRPLLMESSVNRISTDQQAITQKFIMPYAAFPIHHYPSPFQSLQSLGFPGASELSRRNVMPLRS